MDNFDKWLKEKKLVGISGVDTRQITQTLREKGSINAIVAYKKDGKFNFKEIFKKLKNWQGIKNQDLTKFGIQLSDLDILVSGTMDLMPALEQNPVPFLEQDIKNIIS